MTIDLIEAALATDRLGEVSIPITRKALPALFAARGYTTGAEIGVWHGGYSEKLKAANQRLRLLCVDAWQSFHGYIGPTTAYKSPGGMAEAEAAARAVLEPLGCQILKGDSVAVASTVPDRSLDFVYIDGNHSYGAVLADLQAWTPKVKIGGVIAGHDYCVQPAKPFIQVIAAVQTFVRDQDIRQWFVLSGDRTPSFLWVNA
jgi:hypothetical protein